MAMATGLDAATGELVMRTYYESQNKRPYTVKDVLRGE